MILFESLLQRTQRAVIRQTFNGNDRGLVGLNSEHQARAHRLAIIEHGATAADTVLATDMGAGQVQILAQKVGEALARLYCFFNGLAVNRKFNSLIFATRKNPIPLCKGNNTSSLEKARSSISVSRRALSQASTRARRVNTSRGTGGMTRWRGYP